METISASSTNFLYPVALAATLLVCLKARSLGEYLKVMAYPDAMRKKHKAATAQIGGLAILVAAVVWLVGTLALGDGTSHVALTSLLLCAVGVGLIGFTDDQHDTSPLSRILFLIIFLGIGAVLNPDMITQVLSWGSFEDDIIPVWAYCLLVGMAMLARVPTTMVRRFTTTTPMPCKVLPNLSW